jgi:hypothetical protein
MGGMEKEPPSVTAPHEDAEAIPLESETPPLDNTEMTVVPGTKEIDAASLPIVTVTVSYWNIDEDHRPVAMEPKESVTGSKPNKFET